MTALRVLMAGGGTAGHLFPCVAVAEELTAVQPDASVLFIGARGRVDEQILRERDLAHELIDAQPLPYRLSLEAVRGAVALLRSVRQSRAIIRRERPHVVFSTGGYVGASVGIAARLARVPLVLHAADALPDRGNRLLARWASAITLGFQQAAGDLRGDVIVTGNPVRREVAGARPEEGVRELGLDPARPTLLVTGGSQGARRINFAVLEALDALLEDVGAQVVHLSGSLDYETLRAETSGRDESPAAYHLIEHLPNPGPALAAADLAVTRAGAGSLAELCLHAVPMIVVPYPHAGGHQRLNAEPLAESGAAEIVPDGQFTASRLLQLVRGILGDDERRAAMADAALAAAHPGAAAHIAEVVQGVAAGALAEDTRTP